MERLQKELTKKHSSIKMEYILDLLNKIKWDPNENEDYFSIVYEDKVNKANREIPYNNIKRIEGTFFIIDSHGEEINIPAHRIREVRKKGKAIWKRNFNKQ